MPLHRIAAGKLHRKRRNHAGIQRRISRAKKGSTNRYKKRHSLAKEAYRVAERQRTALHRTTTDLVRRHRHFAVEDLNIKNMTAHGGSHKKGLNRSLREQQWGAFTYQLTYTAESAGGSVVKVNPRNIRELGSSGGKVPGMRPDGELIGGSTRRAA